MIASKQLGSLNLAVNVRMLQTALTGQVSAFVFNEMQEIEISSNIVPQSYVCFKLELLFR